MIKERKEEALEVLRDILKELFSHQYKGASYKKFARVHGYADGYMRALLELGIVTKKELLKIVIEERRRYITTDFGNECSLMAG